MPKKTKKKGKKKKVKKAEKEEKEVIFDPNEFLPNSNDWLIISFCLVPWEAKSITMFLNFEEIVTTKITINGLYRLINEKVGNINSIQLYFDPPIENKPIPYEYNNYRLFELGFKGSQYTNPQRSVLFFDFNPSKINVFDPNYNNTSHINNHDQHMIAMSNNNNNNNNINDKMNNNNNNNTFNQSITNNILPLTNRLGSVPLGNDGTGYFDFEQSVIDSVKKQLNLVASLSSPHIYINHKTNKNENDPNNTNHNDNDTNKIENENGNENGNENEMVDNMENDETENESNTDNENENENENDSTIVQKKKKKKLNIDTNNNNNNYNNIEYKHIQTLREKKIKSPIAKKMLQSPIKYQNIQKKLFTYELELQKQLKQQTQQSQQQLQQLTRSQSVSQTQLKQNSKYNENNMIDKNDYHLLQNMNVNANYNTMHMVQQSLESLYMDPVLLAEPPQLMLDQSVKITQEASEFFKMIRSQSRNKGVKLGLNGRLTQKTATADEQQNELEQQTQQQQQEQDDHDGNASGSDGDDASHPAVVDGAGDADAESQIASEAPAAASDD